MKLIPLWPTWGIVLLVLALVAALYLNYRWLFGPGREPGARRSWWRRVGIALLLLTIALGPSIPDTSQTTVSNVEIYFVVDQTGSIAAEDFDGDSPRIDGVRADLEAIRETFPDARYSIISIKSESARELPLTSDTDAVDSWIDSMRQEISARSTGSSLEGVLRILTQSLNASSVNNPQDIRLVYILSDGEETDFGDAASEASAAGYQWSDLQDSIDGGAVLGYGTEQGGPMRSYDGTDNTGAGTDAPYITDPTNGDETAISVIDEAELQSVATDLGLPYYHRTSTANAEQIVEEIDTEAILEDGREHNMMRIVVWPFAIALLGFLGWEAVSLGRNEMRLERLSGKRGAKR